MQCRISAECNEFYRDASNVQGAQHNNLPVRRELPSIAARRTFTVKHRMDPMCDAVHVSLCLSVLSNGKYEAEILRK